MRLLTLLLLAAAVFSCSSENKNTLYLFTWSGFLKPELISKFEEAHQCRVVVDTYDSNESLYAKLKIGSSGYDLIFPSNYYLKILYDQGIIASLDRDKIPNLKELDPRYFKDQTPLLGIPFVVSFSGIAYRKDRVVDLEPSYTVFGREDLRGRMTMINDIREVLGAGLLVHGFSVNSRNPEEIEKAADLVITWKQNLAKFETEQYKNGLATAEFLVSQGYSGDVMQLKNEEENVEFLFPKEGTILAVDYMALLRSAKHADLAYAFMNFMIDPANAAENMTHISALIPVETSYKLLDENMKNSPILFPKENDLEKMELIEDLQEDIRLYYKAWERVRGT